MRIQHNIASMNAYRNYNNNVRSVNTNLEKLSSGYKINRAGDDAAGLAISEKMRAQITGLDAAQKNVKDGISLVKTAEGAMQEIQDMLNRMDYLATQSANGTYDNEVDRLNLQKEVDALKSEINRIADSANFNGIKLLDGSLAGSASTVGGATGGALDMVAVNNESSATGASKDGMKPSQAVGAEFTVTVGSGGSLAGLGSTTISVLAGGSKTVSDLFDAYDLEGNEIDLSADNVTLGSGETKTVTLVAKQKGELNSSDLAAIKGDLAGVTGVANANDVIAINGKDIANKSAGGTRAIYTVTFQDLSGIQGGDKFEINGVEFEFTMDDTTNTDGNYISIKSLDVAGGGTGGADWKTLKQRIYDAVTSADGLNIAANDTTTDPDHPTGWIVSTENKGTTNSNDFVLKAVTLPKGIDANDFNEPKDYQHNGVFTVDFTPAKVEVNPGDGRHAKAVYNLGTVSVGDKVTIGDKTIEIIDKHDSDSDKKNAELAAGKMTVSEFKDANELNKVLQTMGYKDGRVAINGNKLSVEKAVADDTTADAWSKGLGKVSFDKGGAASAAANQTLSDGKGLKLQIGDTADSFNQLIVAIGDMHTKALGIDGINIGNQEGAAAAIQTIKDAINSVSSVRGDLGAIQNRLEHTQNNLSVMQENIQDAESTIRDTDVADEMMKYTKNNILVQSAQAMLAQANQIPQGVLQLLG